MSVPARAVPVATMWRRGRRWIAQPFPPGKRRRDYKHVRNALHPRPFLLLRRAFTTPEDSATPSTTTTATLTAYPSRSSSRSSLSPCWSAERSQWARPRLGVILSNYPSPSLALLASIRCKLSRALMSQRVKTGGREEMPVAAIIISIPCERILRDSDSFADESRRNNFCHTASVGRSKRAQLICNAND